MTARILPTAGELIRLFKADPKTIDPDQEYFLAAYWAMEELGGSDHADYPRMQQLIYRFLLDHTRGSELLKIKERTIKRDSGLYERRISAEADRGLFSGLPGPSFEAMAAAIGRANK